MDFDDNSKNRIAPALVLKSKERESESSKSNININRTKCWKRGTDNKD